MKKIKLTNSDNFILIDDEDFNLVKKYKWRENKRGKKSNTSYAETMINNKNQSVHRLILGITDSKVFVDHINHNGLDNRKINLRLVTHQQNIMNSSGYRKVDKSSKYRGVTFDKERKKWMAKIRFNYRTIFLGRFDKEIDAAKKYDEFALLFFKNFANLNFK